MENKQPGNDKLREKQKQLVQHLSPHLQKQFEELFVHHDRITQILKSDENEKELFKRSPHAFFAKHNIKLPPFIENKLRQFNLDTFSKTEKIVLPNGQVIDAATNINIVLE